MKPLLALLMLAGSLAAQQAEPKPAEPKKEAQPAAAEAAKPAEESKPAEEAKAEPEKPFRGDVELGVRWNQGISGNLDAYRSIVNLGEGLRLMNWDMRFDADKKHLKQARFSGAGWGGDPASWLRAGFGDDRWYRVGIDHRTTAYFNALPSFANPLLERGIFFSQRSFDIQRRFTEAELTLLPASRLIPYFTYTRDRGFGRGVTSFVEDANEYPVLNYLRDQTDIYRGGVRVERRKAHVTLEQGGIAFKDDQRTENNSRITGNRTTPFLGEQLFLNNLLQAYGIRGTSIFTRALGTAQPVSWLDLSGSFQFSQPRNDVSYSEAATGRFVDLDSLLFFNGQTSRITGAAKQPHLTANAGLELRPQHSVRVLQSWTTDRLHNAGSVSDTPFANRLEWNYSQQQTELIVEPVARLTLRGGYRYVWGNGLSRASFLGLQPFERGELKRNVGLAGAGYRITDKLSIHSDIEIARSSQVMFRTSLTDYERIRLRGRQVLTKSLRIYGTFQYLNNSNPPSMNRFEFRNMQESLGLEFMPGSGQGLQMIGEYSRSTIRSDLFFLLPQDLTQRNDSFYRENAHTVTGLVNVPLPVGWTWHPRLTAGGSMFLSNGSRPTKFYQPMTRVTFPIYKRCALLAEYRWYGVSQPFYRFEGFRSHQGIVGLRIE